MVIGFGESAIMPSAPSGDGPCLDVVTGVPSPETTMAPRGGHRSRLKDCATYQPVGLESSTYMSQLENDDGQVGAPLYSFLMLK